MLLTPDMRARRCAKDDLFILHAPEVEEMIAQTVVGVGRRRAAHPIDVAHQPVWS